MSRTPAILVCLGAIACGSALVAAERVDSAPGFPWAIHVFTIPLTLLLGIFVGWALRDRKAANDEARQVAAQQRGDAK
jgi:hypothetical protein